MGAVLSFRPASRSIHQKEVHEFVNETMATMLTEHPWARLLAPSQLVEIHEVFSKFDGDGNGSIEAKELSSVMRRLGLMHNAENVQDMLDAVDLDQNGKVSANEKRKPWHGTLLSLGHIALYLSIEFAEFVLIMAKRILEEDGKVELECAFRLLDKQGKGVVQVDDVQKFLMRAGKVFTQEEADLFAQSCPANANGQMSLADFAAMECWKLPTLRDAAKKTRSASATPRAAEKRRNTDGPGSASVLASVGGFRVVAQA